MSRNSSVDEVSENTGEAKIRNDPTLELNSLYIGTITSPTTSSSWFVSVGMNGTQVRFKLDTGTEANVSPFTECVFKSVLNIVFISIISGTFGIKYERKTLYKKL
jgi:hypothetical protein